MERRFFALGALSALTGVAAGAFGAHALKARLVPEMLAVFEVGVRYQLVHSLALLAVAWAVTRWPGRSATAAGVLFIAGHRAVQRQPVPAGLHRHPRARHGHAVRRRCLHRRMGLPGLGGVGLERA